MEATQTALWPNLYVEDASGVRDTLRDRWRALNEFADEQGGLCPQRAVHHLLGVSQPRVVELIGKGQLHQVKFLGVSWVTGNSISAWMTKEKSKGGRGKRDPRLWDELMLGGKVTAAFVAATTPDRWVE
jgi:predicted DNA-binding transcriptional regulator AlpA